MEVGFMSEPRSRSFTYNLDFNGRESEQIEISFLLYGADGKLLGQGGLSKELTPVPEEYALHQNFPNPFNPNTTIVFEVPESGHIRLDVYDLLGRQVRTLINEDMPTGFKTIVWDSLNERGIPVSAGIYLYLIQAGEYLQTKKMVLLK